MIPKIRHYVWVGSKPMPEKMLRNVASWRKRCPDYEVKLWNGKNFDVNSVPFTRDSCKRGKYGWPADYIRFWACCASTPIYSQAYPSPNIAQHLGINFIILFSFSLASASKSTNFIY